MWNIVMKNLLGRYVTTITHGYGRNLFKAGKQSGSSATTIYFNEVSQTCKKLQNISNPLRFSRTYDLVLKKYKSSLEYVNDSLAVFSLLNARQCGAYVATHGRRMKQLTNIYAKVCAERAFRKYSVVKHVVKVFDSVKELQTSKLSAVLLSTAFVHCQSFAKDIITDLEIERVRDDGLSLLEEIRSNKCANGNKGITNGSLTIENADEQSKKWEMVMDKEQVKIWRKKPDFSTALYEYRVFGTYNDIPASAFWYVQLDLDYRHQWDKYVVKLEILDRDKYSGTELVQWVTHFPYPMEDREYIFIRKHVVDTTNNAMILVSRSVTDTKLVENGKNNGGHNNTNDGTSDGCSKSRYSSNGVNSDKFTGYNGNFVNHNKTIQYCKGNSTKWSDLNGSDNRKDVEAAIVKPQTNNNGKNGNKGCVRVERYHSTMVIKPHTADFNKNGFDYILIYYDDPKTKVPSSAYNKMATTGVMMFIKDVHQAASKLFNDARASDTPSTALNGSSSHYYITRTW